jgi:YD repeat-containing protein
MTSVGSVTYTYDANGNVKSRTYGGGATYTHSYNAENRLVSITSTAYTYLLTYDGDGNKIKTVLSGSASETRHPERHVPVGKHQRVCQVLHG